MAGRNNGVPWFEEISPAEAQEWIKTDPKAVEEYVAKRQAEWNAEQAKLAPGQPNRLAYEAGEYDPAYAAAMQTHHANQTAQATRNALAPLFEGLKPPPPQPRRDLAFDALASKNPEEVKKGKEELAHREFINSQLKRAAELQSMGEFERAKEAGARAQMMIREVEKTRRERPYTQDKENYESLIENVRRNLEEAENLSPEVVGANLEHYKKTTESFNKYHQGEFSYKVDERDNTPKIIRVDHAGRTAKDISERESPDFLLPWRLEDHFITDAPKKETTEEAPKAADDKWSSQKEFEEQRTAEGARKF